MLLAFCYQQKGLMVNIAFVGVVLPKPRCLQLHGGPDRLKIVLFLIYAVLFPIDFINSCVFLSIKLEVDVTVALGQLGQPGSVT